VTFNDSEIALAALTTSFFSDMIFKNRGREIYKLFALSTQSLKPGSLTCGRGDTLKVPTSGGEEEGYQVGKPFTVGNGEKKCAVTMYITSQALQFWNKNYLNLPGRDETILLYHFNEQYYHKYKKMLISVLKRFIKTYKGFPSSIHKTEVIDFSFYLGEHAAFVRMEEDYRKLVIALHIQNLKESEQHIIHEMYHVVSSCHEGEDKMTKLISRWHGKLLATITKNLTLVDQQAEQMLKYCEKEGISFTLAPNYREYLDRQINDFYKHTGGRFWNIINDTALAIIAIELGDKEYLDFCMDRDNTRVKSLFYLLEDHLRIIRHINDNKSLNRKESDLLKSYLHILHFMICFNYFPYESVAYHVLAHSRKWAKEHPYAKLDKDSRASKNISFYRDTVNKYCDKQVSEGILAFCDSYLHIVDAQAIHNDPIDPNITQQIYNTECLNRGKEAYKTLNREFLKLFNELKKFQ
jgi:hypothetical protein